MCIDIPFNEVSGYGQKDWRDFRGVQSLADRVCVAKQVVGMLRQTVGVVPVERLNPKHPSMS